MVDRRLETKGIATARSVRTFLWGGEAAPQKCPCPELSGDRYMNRCYSVSQAGEVQRGLPDLTSLK